MLIRTAAISTISLALTIMATGSEYLVGSYCESDDPNPNQCITKLVQSWEHLDGNGFDEIGSALSESFCAHPRSVLVALIENRENLDTWIGGIPSHTFLVYDQAGTEFSQSATAHLLELKDCMSSQASLLLEDPEIGSAARELEDTLRQTEVGYYF